MKQKIKFFLMVILLVAGISLCRPLPALSYGLLAHEAIIDDLWDKSIVPLLKQKYPGATEEELKKAHAFVYGGAIIPDIGYYPLGSIMFSELVHYVRSGDFITALLEEAKNLNEYAFAIGVLCHYEADNDGHSLATNKAVAIMFPKLKEKYGSEVNFEQGRNQHARVEFGFDVLQTARGNYKPNAYHDFIGFQVADSVLERAFLKTYGMSLRSVFKSLPAAISVFRFSVRNIVPELTKNAWKIKNSFITKLNPLATEKNYQYKMDKKNYYKEYTRPKVQSIILSFVIGALPKVGPLSKFKPKLPNDESEKLFEKSFDAILKHYAAVLNKLHSQHVSYTDVNLDTGKETVMGGYKLADKTYYKLLMKLKRNKFADVDNGLKKNLVAYYSNRDTSEDYGTHSHKGKKITKALEKLNANSLAQDR
jgi:hypothetical protein